MSLMRLPRKAARRLRAMWCGSRGHAAARQVDGIIGRQRVRLSVCSRCEVILAGDVLPSRRMRRRAERAHVDPIALADPTSRLIDAHGKPLRP